jgi:cobaltochelatase CobN
MHRIAAIPGGWNPQNEGVVFIDQTPAPIVIITAADTDIQTLAQVWEALPTDFPELRVTNILALQQQLTIDTYAEDILAKAAVIIVRLLGGVGYWPYGLEVVQEIAGRTGTKLAIVPGDSQPDPSLFSRSTLPLSDVNQIWRYFTEGGVGNLKQLLYFLGDRCLGLGCEYQLPQPVPKVGIYEYRDRQADLPPSPQFWGNMSSQSPPELGDLGGDRIGILFYRAHYVSGNTAAIAALCRALVERNLMPVPLFVSSLRDPDVQAELFDYFQPKDAPGIQVLLNTTSFSLINPAPLYPPTPLDADTTELWEKLNVPVLQVILSGGGQEQWQAEMRGLSPRDTAMNVALPEVDGRIISRAVSFKAVQTKHPILQTEILGYQPQIDRINFVADLTKNWVNLRSQPPADRKIALILANYPNRDGRLANGVGLDTPQSCVEILRGLDAAGYTIEHIPTTGNELIEWLTTGITNDPESKLRQTNQHLPHQDYQTFFTQLPPSTQTELTDRWGLPSTQDFAIAGSQTGNIFLGIQPSRGYDQDPSLNYHAPDLEPTHDYLAFYHWVRSVFQADAIVHVGKHGNLEWLPGKSVALSETCYPEIALGAMPHFYPFIVNDPGEGSQAKRRAQAVIIDHLTPPMTRAELYGDLQEMENLVDEYYEAMNLDPSRMQPICDKIVQRLAQSNLNQDLGIEITATELQNRFESIVLNHLDRSLCELKEAQIRDGLHILGQCPSSSQLRDLVISIARHPQAGRQGLTRAIAADANLDFDPLTADPAEPLTGDWRNVGQAIEAIEEWAAVLVDRLIADNPGRTAPKPPILGALNQQVIVGSAPPELGAGGLTLGSSTQAELTWLKTFLLPALHQTPNEIHHLLAGLNGCYVPSAPSGAPTRGRPEVLPTGRNFYSVDIRAIPTESAWDVGRKAAETLIERYTQENGEYPKTLGLSIWGTATMRTGGDDLAQALALLGVQPIWDSAARRVVDFEIIPLNVLGRPRVDVTLRISGFFRDAFPNLIDLFNQAVLQVATLDEPADQNPLAHIAQQETQQWLTAGLASQPAIDRALYRVFGSKPGAYGAGLQGLIESQNWNSDADLAQAYINWSSYAYGQSGVGRSAPEAFQNRLNTMQIVLQNQDNREHDILDSDDYYQFQGGMTAAVRHLSQTQPTTYLGDNSLTENPKVRSLASEIAKVYRSRVINPKWIAGAMRHGYKGAFEMAATVDFLFGYDATTGCVADHMYQGIADAYLFDEKVGEFIKQNNVWAGRDMAERLLEANQRGLWENASQATLERLRSIVLDTEADIEAKIPIRTIS